MSLLKVARRQTAFTLMELLIVIVILGTLVSVSIPLYVSLVERFVFTEGEQILLAALGAQRRWALDNNGAYTNNLSDLDVDIPESKNFCPPVLATTDPIVSIQRKFSDSDCF